MAEYNVTIDGSTYRVKSDKPLTDSEAYQFASQQASANINVPTVDVTEPRLNADEIAQAEAEFARVPYSTGAETARAGLQGLSLNFADEIEAALRSGAISGKDYESIRDRLRAQQESFATDNPKTALAAEVIGGLAMPAGALGMAAKAPSILKATGIGAGLGAVQGAGQSADSEELTSDIVTGTMLGAGFGAGGQAVGAAIAPQLQRGAEALQREGIPMTVGSAFGGLTQGIEQAAESIPLVGQLVSGARRQQFESFNKAAFNRALKEIDPKIKVPESLPLREAADFTFNQISNKYNTIYPNISLKYNKTLDRQFNALEKKHNELGDKAVQFKSTLANIQGRVKDKALSGAQIKALKEDLRKLTDAYQGTTGSEKLLGNAYNDLENSIMLSIRNQNPKLAKDLKKADTAYATYKRVENAAASAKGAEGVFTPAQLETAVKQGNKSQFARGRALLQDLSNAGYDVLGNKVPDSGTASRLGLAALATGGAGFLDPSAAAGTAIASSLYTPFGMRFITPMLTSPRPEMINQYGTSLRGALPFAGSAINPLFRNLLGEEQQ